MEFGTSIFGSWFQNYTNADIIDTGVYDCYIERMIMMKRYELMIERHQPPCGGKQTRLCDFCEVETDDPVSYVRKHEPGLPQDMQLEVDSSHTGVVCVCFTRGIQPVKYEFTEI